MIWKYDVPLKEKIFPLNFLILVFQGPRDNTCKSFKLLNQSTIAFESPSKCKCVIFKYVEKQRMHHKANNSLLVFVPFPQFIMILKVPFTRHFKTTPAPHFSLVSWETPSKKPIARSQSSKGGLSILSFLMLIETIFSLRSWRILL